jgi:hypothetical protein
MLPRKHPPLSRCKIYGDLLSSSAAVFIQAMAYSILYRRAEMYPVRPIAARKKGQHAAEGAGTVHGERENHG